MRIEKVARMQPPVEGHAGQDGAFWGDWMFRFDADGSAWAFDARPLNAATEDAQAVLPLRAAFHTDAGDAVVPHFNAVAFGCEYYAPGDEFPLLYANLYNNYAAEEDRREGVCCVYRLQRAESSFAMTLVQVIRVGFVQDASLWCSGEKGTDVRPYGNFVVDREKGVLYAYTMRDAVRQTRYFAFALPKLSGGDVTAEYGVRTVTLEAADVLEHFDTEYHQYVQGGCWYGGYVYSSEGFDVTPPPALRVIDPAQKRQLAHADLAQLGFPREAEWIDFYNGACYYSDAAGDIYRVGMEL